MNSKNLTRYVFWDKHEEVTNSNGKIIAIRDAEKGVTNYIPLKSIFIRKYIQGSTSIPYSKEFSREPKEGEYLITGSKFFGWFGHISISPIEKIEKNFILPQTS
jgi:hypothetical protein